MKSTFFRVLGAMGIAALAVAAAPAAGGAGALVPSTRATASLDVHQVLAGAQQTFTLTVRQPVSGLLTPVRSVQISAPAELFTISAPIDPAGWTGTVSGSGSTLTYKATGGGIVGGTSQAFTFVADALRPAADLARSFAVSTSTDTGTTSTYTPVAQSPGALGVRVRTLEILGVAVLDPAPLVGDPTLHVTRGQDAVVGVRVGNAGGAAQTIAATLAGESATTSAAAPVELAPGELATVPFDVTFGDALGHGKLVANASAGESVAAQKFLAYVALEPLELLIDPDNLTPATVVPGRTASFVQFLAVRGADDAPALDLDPVASEYRFADGALRASLGAALHLEAGGGRWLPPTPPVIVPALADGPYGGVLHLEGTDAHGAAFVADLPLRSGSLVVDSLAPVADLVLAGGPLTNGSTVPLAGDVLDGGAACGVCTLDASHLDVLDADGAVIQAIAAPATLDTDGQLAGEVTVAEWPATASATRWVATVSDAAGLSSTTVSHPRPIDLVAPHIVRAATTDREGFANVIVTLDEWVGWGEPTTAPQLDFRCDGQVVTDGATSYHEIWLQVTGSSDRDRSFECTYDASGSPAVDQAGNELADTTFLVEDGIAPLAPVVDAPTFTNTSTPTLSITELQPGNDVSVFEDGFLVGSGTAEGDSLDVTTDSLGTIDRAVHLEVLVTDAAGNVGPATPVDLTLDFTAPALADAVAQRADRQVTVTFAEPLVGPDAVDDWFVAGPTATGPRQRYTLGSADVEGAVVTLTVADPRFDPATMTLDEVGYEVLAADGSTRLTDRAGNVLPDGASAV
jgi:uncharacterized protein YcnI